MYREYEKLYAHELIEYDRKSRADDTLLSVEEVLEKHGKMLDEFARNNFRGPIPKEEIKNALCKAYESMPKPVNYKEKIMKFTDAIKALEDPEIPASIKNQFLKDIIDRIEYSRPKTKRLIQKNVKGLQYEREPYKITIKLK